MNMTFNEHQLSEWRSSNKCIPRREQVCRPLIERCLDYKELSAIGKNQQRLELEKYSVFGPETLSKVGKVTDD